MDRRPKGCSGEVRLPAVGQIAQDDLGDAREQDTCGMALVRAMRPIRAVDVQASQEENTSDAEFPGSVHLQLEYCAEG